ncbi:hypothetical protein [Chengkuizengella axinellae]|uniref:Uncharacterized protein n=1 Tax=Chengkuizengella axinellae TaxID=3064388 RepID=A0ABT9J3I7_9BACL|nr:hypothetical protein [Chengkuizengella sp. 2205SS18-9]MDP5276181.1 hypothetical protein [Chengkuizengella sp. 2205SS18-9]
MILNHEKILEKYIESSRKVLSDNDLKGVWHYYNHDEYEMSFEGLIIELTQTNKYPDDFIFKDWEKLALYYKLNTDSVFDMYIWDKFINWGRTKQ